jgi:hypothetical protein
MFQITIQGYDPLISKTGKYGKVYFVDVKIIGPKEIITIKRGEEIIVLESNRPYLRRKPGLKRWKAKYKLMSGDVRNNELQDFIIELDKVLDAGKK